MKFAVNMNSFIRDGLRSECIGGEWRWERQVLEALLLCPEVEKVSTFQPVWKSPHAMPSKLADGLNKNEMLDTICIFYYSIPVAAANKYKGMIINTHHFPHHDISTYSKFTEQYGSKWFFSYDRARPEAFMDKNYREIGCENNWEPLPIPAVPQTYQGSNFNKKIILFPSKGIIGALRYPPMDWGSEGAPGKDMFTWVAKKLAEDSSMEFHVLSSYVQGDLDFLHCTDLEKEFFSFPITRCLTPYRDRIVVHRAIGWDQILDLYSKTKIVVSSTGGGGMAMEAAAYGIPVVSHINTPMSLCPEYLEATLLSEKYFSMLDELYYNESCYNRVGSGYRAFIEKHYTYKAFTDNLFSILKKRGMT